MHTHHTDEGAPSATTTADPVAAARRVLAEDTRTRVEACAQEIAEVLAKHGMRLETTPAQITLAPISPSEVDG